MTPKEKAIQIEEKFRLNVLDYEGCGINEHKAKQCALIAVDEIIKNGGTHYIIEYKPNSYTNQVWFWQEVKEEIEKL